MNVLKLGPIVGKPNLYNEVICTNFVKSISSPKSVTIFFGGDVQDYPEVMSSHRDRGTYIQWNLLNMSTLLSLKFPSSTMCVIKPNRMEFKTFSCYDNFVTSSELGAPTHTEMHGALSHLQLLISNTLKKLLTSEQESCASKEGICQKEEDEEDLYNSINLIGFSKGCVVLNQLITEVHTIFSNSNSENEDLRKFWKKVRSIYWLDGGHSGGKNTWVTNRPILSTLASFQELSLHVHVTPYQVRDERRPWIGKECKSFIDALRRAKADVHYKLHFEDEIQSLDNHFRVLDDFK